MHNRTLFQIVRFLGLPIILGVTIALFFLLSNVTIISPTLTLWITIPLLILEIMIWIAFVFKYTRTEYKIALCLKRNVKIILVIFCVIISCLAYDYFTKGDYEFAEYSPCGKYELKVYSHPHIFAMPGGGGHYSRSVTIILKNRWGLTIGRSNEEIIYADLEIEWDYINSHVWISRGHAIDF